MKNINDLREHLFATLEALRDEKRPMEVERARAIAQVAQTVIESAKVEVSYMRELEAKGTGFLSSDEPAKPRLVKQA